MLVYKVPTYARIFGIQIHEWDLGVWWFSAREGKDACPMNAREIEISERLIRDESGKPGGYRIFHPYFKEWPVGD